MTIAHLVINGDVAGGQIVALQLARAARARGDRVVFLSPTRGPFTELVEREGMEVRLVDVSRTYKLGGALRLARRLRAMDADVLHTHTALAANVLSRAAGRLGGAAVVSHVHIENHFRPNRAARAIHTALDNGSARLAARVLAVSDDTRRSLVAQGYPPQLVEVVHNGIDAGAEAARHGVGLRAELGVPEDAVLIGEIARLCDVKGQRDLIEAVALVPGVHVALAGADLEQGGAYRAMLERLAGDRGVASRVHFLGFRARRRSRARPARRARPPVVDRGTAGDRARGDGARQAGDRDAGRRHRGARRRRRDRPARAAARPRAAGRCDPHARLAIAELRDRLGRAGRKRVERDFSETAMTRRVLEVYDAVA